MTRATFADITNALTQASMPMRELHGPGHVAVTSAAGRIVALAFTRDGSNLLWSNPDLRDTDRVKNRPETLLGGLGGDRLWFAPELDYHWKGVPDWRTANNYDVPADTDPGHYEFSSGLENTVQLRNTGQLTSRLSGERVGFEVTRTIRMVPSPLSDNEPSSGVSYIGIETSHVLQFDHATESGKLDLWHLLQVPAGATLIVPLKEGVPNAAKTPLSYAFPGGWIQKQDRILWRYGGTSHSKIGVSAQALTGRTAILQRLGSEYCLMVRQFAVDESAKYADHPYGDPRIDQAFQAWDGMGFGEMEYHSPLLDARDGPRILKESDQLWAFRGSKASILTVADRLLHRDLTDAFAIDADV